MKQTTPLLAFAAALLTAVPTLAGPNCSKNGTCDEDDTRYEVADREDQSEGERKAERGEKRKADRGERAERREGRSPMQALGLSEDQQAQAKEVFSAAKEQARAVMAAAKQAHENGEEVDRKAIREQLMAIRKDAMEKVYATVLNDEQRAMVDEHRKRMEERRAKREAEGGERGERPERRKERGANDELDL